MAGFGYRGAMFAGRGIHGWLRRVVAVIVMCAGCFARAQVPTLTNSWTLSLGSPSDSSAALGDDGTIYFGTFDGGLWAVKPDRTKKWIFKTSSQAGNMEIRSSPAIGDDGTIYFGCRDGKVYAVTAAGRLRWAFETDGWVDSSPAIGADGTVYAGSWDKHLYAIGAAGVLKWKFKTAAEVTSSPAIGPDGTIHFGSHDRKLYALKPDGTQAWEHATGGPIISSPALDRSGSVFFTSLDGHLYSLNRDGKLRWKLHTGGITESSPVLGADRVVYVGVNKTIWAVGPEGNQLWQREVTMDAYQQPVWSTPTALEDGSVCAISGYGWLTAIDSQLRSKWGIFLGQQGKASPAVATDGTIYVQHYVLNAARPGAKMAASTWPRFRGNVRNDGRVR